MERELSTKQADQGTGIDTCQRKIEANVRFSINIRNISPKHLRGYIRTWRPNRFGLLFATRNGTPWDTDTLRKRKLHPLLRKLGIERCGFHAFRHGNATIMDQEQVPIATRQNRLGQSDARTTMGYTHAMSEDGRVFAAHIGQMLTTGNA